MEKKFLILLPNIIKFNADLESTIFTWANHAYGCRQAEQVGSTGGFFHHDVEKYIHAGFNFFLNEESSATLGNVAQLPDQFFLETGNFNVCLGVVRNAFM
jgi:hypothetical protein